MISLDDHFFKHFSIDMSRVGTLGKPLESEGVGVEIYNGQVVIIKKSSSSKEVISTFDISIFKLTVFLNQYKYSDKNLPFMPSSEFRRQYQPNLIELSYDNDMYQRALTILRDSDITSYSQLTKLILNYKSLVGAQYLESTRFGEKIEEWYFGDKHQYDGYKFVLNHEGFWELMHIEKGNGKAVITFFDVTYVYQYLLIFYFTVL